MEPFEPPWIRPCACVIVDDEKLPLNEHTSFTTINWVIFDSNKFSRLATSAKI